MACSYSSANPVSRRPHRWSLRAGFTKAPQLVSVTELEHIAETRPSSSEFIATNRNAPMRIRHGDRYRRISTARILFHDECGVILSRPTFRPAETPGVASFQFRPKPKHFRVVYDATS